MLIVENSVKQQFARVFILSDWHLFKSMAECYLRQAAFLRMRDLDVPTGLRRLVRNSQKRLFIGVGIELLLKALYLKNGYAINKLKGENQTAKFPFKLREVDKSQLREDQTFLLGILIDQSKKVIVLNEWEAVLRGLRIAQVFRNKEGHVVTPRHAYVASNYRDIESALRELYRTAFGEILEVQFSLAPNEKPLWRIYPTSSAVSPT
jgi:hypothetical protein